MTVHRFGVDDESAASSGGFGMAISFHGQGHTGNCRMMATEHPGEPPATDQASPAAAA
jgi:hypothetical protein